jgi:hypothetical protein
LQQAGEHAFFGLIAEGQGTVEGGEQFLRRGDFIALELTASVKTQPNLLFAGRATILFQWPGPICY